MKIQADRQQRITLVEHRHALLELAIGQQEDSAESDRRILTNID